MIKSTLSLVEHGARLAVIVPKRPTEATRKFLQAKKHVLESVNVSMDEIQEEGDMARLIGGLSHDGVLVQLPLSDSTFDPADLFGLPAEKDVDRLKCGRAPGQVFPTRWTATATALQIVLAMAGDLDPGFVSIVVGRGRLVGKPVADMLAQFPFFSTVVHTDAHREVGAQFALDVADHAKVVVAATGMPASVGAEWCNHRAFGIDFGSPKAEFTQDAINTLGSVTPVPGTMGPWSCLALGWATQNAARLHRGLLPVDVLQLLKRSRGDGPTLFDVPLLVSDVSVDRGDGRVFEGMWLHSLGSDADVHALLAELEGGGCAYLDIELRGSWTPTDARAADALARLVTRRLRMHCRIHVSHAFESEPVIPALAAMADHLSVTPGIPWTVDAEDWQRMPTVTAAGRQMFGDVCLTRLLTENEGWEQHINRRYTVEHVRAQYEMKRGRWNQMQGMLISATR